MPKIFAKNRYLHPNKNQVYVKLGLVILLGAGLALLNFFLLRNYLSLLTLVICTILIIIFMLLPAKEITVEIQNDGLLIDRFLLPWTACHSWVMVNLEDKVEFIIQTTNLDSAYYYFYADPEQEDFAEFLEKLATILPYNEEIENKNVLHKVLRFLSLS